MLEALKSVMSGRSLNEEQAYAAMNSILENKIAAEQIGGLLIALQCKQETVEEITGFVRALRAQARLVDTNRNDLVDTCGTGGDSSGTFNISTTVAFVAAAAGLGIAKHGNRAVSSKCGSFDVLEKLGLPFHEVPEDVLSSLKEFNLTFMLAPAFHPALKDLGALRRRLGVKTVFNLLGPLLNPASVKRQIIGVYSPKLVTTVAHVLLKLGTDEAMVVCGDDGLDEFTLTTSTQVAHLKDGKVSTYSVRPEDAGLKPCSAEALKGGNADDNAAILKSILNSERGPKRDIVLLNTAAALVVGGQARDLREGVAIAAEAIDSGQASRLLERMIL